MLGFDPMATELRQLLNRLMVWASRFRVQIVWRYPHYLDKIMRTKNFPGRPVRGRGGVMG